MKDKSPKKENKSETIKVKRDKNGRFASKDGGQKNPDDGKVKIKVVKDKKPSDKKNTPKWEYKFLGTINDDWLDCLRYALGNAYPDTSLMDFVAQVATQEPQTLTFNGHTYYSEENVAKKIEQTISTCAETASKEIEKMESAKNRQEQDAKGETLPNMPKQYQNEQHSVGKNATARRLANIAARVIMWTFVAGFAATAIFGIASLLRIIAQ